MTKENYKRILKGYEPREPTTFAERAFYVLWCLWIALKVLAWRFRHEASVRVRRMPK